MDVLSLFDNPPAARRTDPSTSHLAGLSTKASRKELVAEIHNAVWARGPMTQEQIARAVSDVRPGRWMLPTIVSACASADLYEWDRTTNDRGRTVIRWSLVKPAIQRVEVNRDVL